MKFSVAAFIFFVTLSLGALPVPLGSVQVGLDSFDGYQEGMAKLSTDEAGNRFEILLAYKGFGLDSVFWTFDDVQVIRELLESGAYWRSRLLEHNIAQEVTRDLGLTTADLLYSHRGRDYPFSGVSLALSFVKQGRDYALEFSEDSPGAERRRIGVKSLPVFTLHFIGSVMAEMRDLISEENLARVLSEYAAEKAMVESILATKP